VLDVKVGSGAFLPDRDTARQLAETMVALGNAHSVRTVALLTDMEAPLGRACGNGLEVTEAVEVLSGAGPPDVLAVTLALAGEMVALAGIDADPAKVLADGQALSRWHALIQAQGGDSTAPLAVAPYRRQVTAPAFGYLQRLDARAVGVAAWRLGAGRARKEDPVSPTAGIVCLAKPGDLVEEGQPLLELHADTPDRFETAMAALADAIGVGAEPLEPRPLIIDRIGS
jgi:thymidine phosphorylase